VKKFILIVLMLALLSGTVFAQKHNAGEMLLGLNLGTNITPTFGKVTGSGIPPMGNYAITFSGGLTFDYYLFSWLSLNTGVFSYPGLYLLLDKDITKIEWENTKLTDWAKAPVCFTIPIMAHINVPVLTFLYAGIGLNLNFPVSTLVEGDHAGETIGGFFLGIPIDLGFDFIKAGKGGGRFMFRMTPEFHSGGTVFLTGFMWQIYNFRLKKVGR